MASTLRVRARSGIVTRFDLMAQDPPIRRMVCARLVPHPDAPNKHAFVHTDEVENVPNMKEFRDAVKDGALWAADEETARECFGARWRDHFDPSFGMGMKAAPAAASTAPPSAEEKAQ